MRTRNIAIARRRELIVHPEAGEVPLDCACARDGDLYPRPCR
jgi:hypothetical protein